MWRDQILGHCDGASRVLMLYALMPLNSDFEQNIYIIRAPLCSTMFLNPKAVYNQFFWTSKSVFMDDFAILICYNNFCFTFWFPWI